MPALVGTHPFLPAPNGALPCPGSVHCRPAADLLGPLGLPPSLPWRWVHVGPIQPGSTLIGSHGTLPQPCPKRDTPPPPIPGRRKTGAGRTWPELLAHPGYRLDLFGLNKRPPVQAQYWPVPRLWVVYAAAYRDPAGPHAVWTSRLDAPCELSYYFGDDHPSADTLAELGRMYDLLAGRRRRRGRRSLAEDTQWRTIAEQAEVRYAARPGQGWAPIGAVLNVDLRTLRRYRALLRREQSRAGTGGPMTLVGADAR